MRNHDGDDGDEQRRRISRFSYRSSTRPRGLSIVAMMAGADPGLTRSSSPSRSSICCTRHSVRVFRAQLHERCAFRRGQLRDVAMCPSR